MSLYGKQTEHLDTPQPDGERPERSTQSKLRWAAYALIAIFAAVVCLLRWGGYLLVTEDDLPARADGAVVLQGSILAEQARLAGAVQLLNAGIANRLLVSIPRESYWGQAIAPIASNYLGRTYGAGVSDRTDFCETGPDVSSTEEEARTLVACAEEHSWHSLIVVTSDYHTRRAGIIWRKTMRARGSPIRLSIYGVSDPEFYAVGWWRDRLSAKTWLLECTKLLWTVAGK
jgi:uncharacterized SAM-binding protein YcdF (DUF218 family)